jgi:hypothetical protein
MINSRITAISHVASSIPFPAEPKVCTSVVQAELTGGLAYRCSQEAIGAGRLNDSGDASTRRQLFVGST